MRFTFGLTIAAVTLAGVGLAQTPPDQPGRPDGPPGRAGQDGARPRDGARARDGARRQDPLAMLERLAQQLNLDDAQKTQFDAIISKHRAEFEKNADSTRELMQQMRAARQSGDDAKATEIRQQIAALRKPGQMEQVLDEVEAILTDAQKEQLGQIRDRMARMGERGSPGDPIARLEQLGERLKLDDAQTAQFKKLLDGVRTAIKPADGESDPMQLQREMREAAASGDREQAARIRKQLDAHRQKVQTAVEDMFKQLEPTLNDDQKAILADARATMQRRPGGPDGARGNRQNDPRLVIRAAKRLDLTDEQKTQLEAIEADTAQKVRDAGRADAEEQAKLKTDVEKQIRAILTSDQARQFDQFLERLSNGGRGGPPRDDAGDQPRRRRPAPPAGEKP